jgi:hypothetical protein
MGAIVARVFLWLVLVIAWALVVVFGAAVVFGGDLLTRIVGLVIALIALAIALGTGRLMRRFRHAKPPAVKPEPLRPPPDLDHGGFDFPGLGHFKDRTALHLDRNGFDAIRLGKPRRYSWADVESFRVVDISTGGASVVYGRIRTAAFALRGRGDSFWGRVARWGTGADVLLPAVAMDPDELVEAMERYRQRYSPVVYTDS